jgi:PIN domain nuclease of toxin-antitoxin system
MNIYATDTHSLYWYLTDTRKLPKAALRAFEEGENGLALILCADNCFVRDVDDERRIWSCHAI